MFARGERLTARGDVKLIGDGDDDRVDLGSASMAS